MNKFFKYFEYAYLCLRRSLFLKPLEYGVQKETEPICSCSLYAIAIFMFFFKRRFRRKYEDRNK